MVMHAKFADWYGPVSFGTDGEKLSLRWKSVESFLGNCDHETLLELVRLVFGRKLLSNDSLDSFRSYFKKVDATFLTEGNDKELRALASSVLALLCVDDQYDKGNITLVTLAILTTSACGFRKVDVEMDLVGMASERMYANGVESRSRLVIATTLPTNKNAIKKSFEDAISPLEVSYNHTNAVRVMTGLGSATGTHLINIQKGANDIFSRMGRLLRIQDEELQILWWIVGGWSRKWNSAFGDIGDDEKPILLAEEVAELSAEIIEPPSLKSIFFRAGLSEPAGLSIAEAVNSCGVDNLEQLTIPSDLCNSIFPIHSAMGLAKNAGGGKSWVSLWREVSGIKASSKPSPIDFAIQVYRERKLMTFTADEEG